MTLPSLPQLRLMALLVFVSACATVAAQWWIGDATIYSDDLADKRAHLHASILHNQAPGPSWDAVGAMGTNIRVLAVFVAEAVMRVSGLDLGRTYKLLDSLYLFASSIALVFYLRRWLPPVYCAIGMLYFWVLVTITYQNYLFHPWDRPSVLTWLLLLHFVRADRLGWLLLVLPVAIALKNDAIFLPALYFLTHIARHSVVRVTLVSGTLTAVAFGTWFALLAVFPGDGAAAGALERTPLVVRNLEALAWMGPAWPPLLFHGAITVLALSGIARRERFHQVSVLYGAVFLMAPWFLMSLFHEVRAHWPFFLLLLPPALMTLREWLDAESGPREMINAKGSNT